MNPHAAFRASTLNRPNVVPIVVLFLSGTNKVTQETIYERRRYKSYSACVTQAWKKRKPGKLLLTIVKFHVVTKVMSHFGKLAAFSDIHWRFPPGLR
jgi:hypothetical protein